MKKLKSPLFWTCVLLCGGLVWHASLRQPTGPAFGTRLEGEKNLADARQGAFARKTLRLATFNVHSCYGEDGRYDVDRIAVALKNADFVALNEVGGVDWPGEGDQASLLGQKLGMASLFAPSVRQWHFREFGNGFLTKAPIVSWQRIPLPRKLDLSYRNMVLVRLSASTEKSPDREIQVLITHLNQRYDEERRNQLEAAASLFLSLKEPAVLLGDLNSTEAEPIIEKLKKSSGVVDPLELAPREKTADHIDWILLRGLKAVAAGIEKTDASDHPVVWTEIE